MKNRNTPVTTRTFALIFGIAYLGAGLLGLLPGMLTPPPGDAPALRVQAMNGMLLGLFHVNLLHTLVHLAIGAWGLAAYAGWSSPRMYARSLAVVYGVLAVMGLVPGLNTLFGLVPLHGHDVWLHLATAAVAAYFGFFAQPAPARAERRYGAGDRRRAMARAVHNERRSGIADRRRMPAPA